MSTFEIPRRSYATAAAIRIAAVLPALATMLRAGIAYFDAGRRARRTARVLHRLSDRELKDIGLTRSDIGRSTGIRPGARSDD